MGTYNRSTRSKVRWSIVLAVLDQKEYSIAVYRAIANLAYAENTAAGVYFNAAITVTTAYCGLNFAQNDVKSAQAEVRQRRTNYKPMRPC
jgi:multidrug resistance efflux pump